MSKKAKPIRHLIVVSDTHCGSTCALMPPSFETIEGQIIHANPVQLWLWGMWSELWGVWVPQVTRGEPFAVVINGDAIEGNHHRTKEIVSPEIADHVGIAEVCFQPIVDTAAAIFITRGTEVHTGNIEDTIAKIINAIGPNGKPGAWPRFDAYIDGLRVIIQHHISTAIRTWTEATALGAALASERLEAASVGETIPSVLGSAHRHRHGVYMTSSGISFVTGPWQALTRHGQKVVASARCTPTAVAMEFDGAALPRVREFVRKPPPAPSITL